MKFPQTFSYRASTGNVELVQVPAFFAVLDCSGQEPVNDEVYRLDPATAICRGELEQFSHTHPEHLATPLYKLGTQGPVGVPTGLIFVRLADGRRLSDVQGELQRFGFEIERVAEHSPNMGWVRHSSGDSSTSLTTFHDLEGVSGVEHIEPQVLFQKRTRR